MRRAADFITLSSGIARRADLDQFLGGTVALHRARAAMGKRAATRAVITWGRKIERDKAESKARALALPLWRLEDGFLAYAQHPAIDSRAFSLIVDRSGIYYDATRPSDFEALCLGVAAGTVAWDESRTRRIMEAIRTEAFSKYNHIRPDPDWTLPGDGSRKRILLVDQTQGDRSIHYGLGSEEAFSRMVAQALTDHPDAAIYARVHPDSKLASKRGYLRERLHPRIHLLDGAINIVQLLQAVDEVYVVTSQVGFEALLLGKKVHCFGMPFYAGWGLTEDALDCPRRTVRLSREQLAAVALILYPRYVHPETRKTCEIEDILIYLSSIRTQALNPDLHFEVLGFSTWKRGILRRFLQGRTRSLRFVRDPSELRLKDPRREALLVWGMQFRDTQEYWRRAGYTVVQVEDGFIRSVGLGVDLKRPSSLVFDRHGLYYDATLASGLERILNETDFSEGLCAQARGIRDLILRHDISKYNVQRDAEVPSSRFPPSAILVVGQVAGDASLRQGRAMASHDAEFLQLVRERHPLSFLVYKPHPDVLSKNREQPPVAADLYDLMITDLSLSACVRQVESVHVMTSLAGFETLLQGKPVYTYGMPFYAGWGLTVDALTCDRRQRRLSLDELIAGALILYPSYYNWSSFCHGTVDGTIALLSQERAGKEPRIGSRKVERWWRKIQYFLESRGIV